jgi:hypothetical protein
VSATQGKVVFACLGVLVLGAAVFRFAPKLVGAVEGPEADMVGMLLRTEQNGLSLAVPGSATPLVSKHHHYDRVTVQTDMGARTAEAASTLDFTGSFGKVEVSSLGVEKTHFEYRDGWVATQGLAPRLAAVVRALEARRRALEAGDEPALAQLMEAPGSVAADPDLRVLLALKERSYGVRAWYVRLDRDEATVGEDYRLRGELPDRPVDQEGKRTLTLKRRGAEFFFAKGLM